MKDKGGWQLWNVYRHDNGAPELVDNFRAKSRSHAVNLAVVNNPAELLEPYGAGQLSAKPAGGDCKKT